jgi:hypothetical protein
MSDAAPRVFTQANIYEYCWSLQFKPSMQKALLQRKGATIDGLDYKQDWLQIETYNVFCIICAFTQIFLCYLIFADRIEGMAASQKGEVMVARILCTVVLHFSFQTENANALKLFKYTCMNFDKFQNPRYALLLIQLQLLISVFIELISMAALNSYDSVGAVVANFLAMTVLRSFDDVFLVQFMNPKMKQFQELEIPRYKFKAEKIVIEDEFDVAHDVYTEKHEMIKKHVEVVEPAADENDESQRGEDEGKVAPAPEAEAKTVKLTWKGDVAFAD